jgi:tetratricopeptide (TPR) repeat protein
MAHDHHLYMLLADTAARQHDEAGLREYAPRLEELAVRDNHQLYLGIAHRAWGVAHRLASEHAGAEARLKQALEQFESLGTRWQIGHTLLEMGELDLAEGDRTRAHDHFSRALEAFEALKAMPDAERARAALDASG